MKEVDVVVDTMTPEQILGLSTEQRARYAEILAERAIELEQAQDSKKSPYRQWLQVNNDKTAYQAEDNLIRKSATAYRVLRFFRMPCKNRGGSGGESRFCGQDSSLSAISRNRRQAR